MLIRPKPKEKKYITSILVNPILKRHPTYYKKLRSIDTKVIEYSNSLGNLSLREKWASYYQNLGYSMEASNLIITTGGSEALIFAFMSCFDTGDDIIIPEPYYANYNGFSTSCGINVKTITCSIQNGFALPSMLEIEKKNRP
jgi:aspartate aminotransferase